MLADQQAHAEPGDQALHASGALQAVVLSQLVVRREGSAAGQQAEEQTVRREVLPGNLAGLLLHQLVQGPVYSRAYE